MGITLKPVAVIFLSSIQFHKERSIKIAVNKTEESSGEMTSH